MDLKYINADLLLNLNKIISCHNDTAYIKCTSLVKCAKQCRETIEKYYNSILYYNAEGADLILCESYYKLEQVCQLVIKSFNNLYLPSHDGKYPDFYYCLKIAIEDKSFEICNDSIIELIEVFEQNRYLKSVEFDFIQPMIGLVVLTKVKNIIKDGNMDTVGLERAVGAAYNSDMLDIQDIIDNMNKLENMLKTDPSGVYLKQTVKTKNHYRYMLSKISRKKNIDELSLAENLLKKANTDDKRNHIGFYIFDEYSLITNKTLKQKWHLKIIFLLPVLLVIPICILIDNWYIAPIIYVPLIELLRPLVEYFIIRGVERHFIPTLELENGVVSEYKTAVVLSTLVPETHELVDFKYKLEQLILSNKNGEINFVVLADLKQSNEEIKESDKIKVDGVDKVISELNRVYGDKLLMLIRKRVYSKTQKMYCGKDRKRGAITDLISIIKGGYVSLAHHCGKMDLLNETKYIIALDYDTKLMIDSVKEYIQIAAHPINIPIINHERKIVESGYGIIAPKIITDLKSSLKTPFTRVMGGIGGISCYDTGCSEMYQDIYSESIFTGKGLINVDAYYEIITDKFESETVLSHDILEGCFLRTLYAGGIEATDNFPESAEGFFKRLHRWVRGDFQNTPYIFKYVKVNGKKTISHLDGISRYKIFDNLRRAITPLFSLACIALAIFSQHAWVLVLIALLSISMSCLFSFILKLVTGQIRYLFSGNYSKVLPQSAELILRALMNIILLPQYAIIGLDAAIRGLFRRYISKRKMLEWTTSAQLQGKSQNFLHEIAYFIPCILAGLILIFVNKPLLIIVGLLFISALPVAIFTKRKSKLSSLNVDNEKRYELVNELKQMFKYYDDFCNEENNYLPPDNVQFAPVYREALRTSPTNIGLMLLSMLTARDFSVISTYKLYNIIAGTISTVEKLEKYHGNLYNWYDIRSLEKLPSYFVSTVDSGNLLCCLVCLKEGLKEYEHEYDGITSIIERIGKLVKNTDLSVFYDKKSDLFSIGYDQQSDSLSNSHYDMLMSEARMTSYFAIAKGQVRKKHWSSLSRTLSKQDGHTGPISWTGTMFEYFMPELLLHCIRGSIGYEGLKYCIQCQKNRIGKTEIPYGISESAIYEFDGEFNYQYNANGVQRIALKQGMDNDLVISPYSTYLTLSIDFDDSYNNLMKIKKLHAKGKYGLYEAIDYTQKRIGENSLQVVKSYMAHHLGMSIVAIDNALNNNIMQKRFLRDKDMSRATELLQEKMQVGEAVILDQIKRERQYLPENTQSKDEYVGHLYPNSPRVKLFNNNELTSVVTDLGASFIKFKNTDITRRTTDMLRNALGTFCFVKANDEIMSLTYAPSYNKSISYETSFNEGSAKLFAKGKNIRSVTEVMLHRTMPCEQRKIKLENISNSKLDTSALIYIEPVLFPFEDDFVHKAFSKLFINISYDRENKIVVVERKKRSNEEIFYMAVGFHEDIDFDLETNRENVFQRGDVINVSSNVFTDKFEESTGVPDPCIAIRINFNLDKSESKSFNLLTSVAENRNDAIRNILALRKSEPVSDKTCSKSQFLNSSLEQRLAQTILPQILFNKRNSSSTMNSISNNTLGFTSLWGLGISGDLPIVLVDIINEGDTERIKAYSKCHSLLRICGIAFDLVFTHEKDNECKPAIEQIIREYCGDAVMNTKGGIYSIDKSLMDEQQQNFLDAVACHTASRSMVRIESPQMLYTPIVINEVNRNTPKMTDKFEILGGCFDGRSFYVTETPKLPWCNILANSTFGTLMSDKALGFTWAINARENKLTPWYNDTIRDNNGEMLILKHRSQYYDIVNGSTAEFNPQYTKYHGKLDGIRTKVEVKVPKRGMIKYIDVTIENKTDIQQNIEMCYYTEPVINVSRQNSRFIKGELTEKILLLNNPLNLSSHAYMGLSAQGESFDYVCDRTSFFSGRWDIKSLPPTQDICVAITVKKTIPPDKAVKLRFILAFATTKEGVIEQIRKMPEESYLAENKIYVNTGDKSVDLMVNTWLPHQILSSRIYGRTGFYQCGGAYGFRDQIQDVSAYMLLSPRVARTHIIRCCASQFEAGDVFHWWHSMPQFGGGKKGVRTRYSDDLVWLPYVLCQYLSTTGDMTILDVKVKYLQGNELKDGQKDSYMDAKYTDYKETVFKHCKKAIKRAYNLGEHGLVKIGSGDWNDGYSKVGIDGIGESVWLTQFLAMTMYDFAEVCDKIGENEAEYSSQLRKDADNMLNAVDKYCYDGDHYIRAFYDNGEMMGAYSSEECKIDSLPQSFAVLAGMKDKARIDKALKTAYDVLVDSENGIIKLFSPAFDISEQNPGYVKAYPRGVRENGGQYTHASVWLAIAMCKANKLTEFHNLTKMLNPIKKYMNKAVADKYKVEPYFVSADIYTNEYSYGRGGWSMYTGAAGWYYQLLVKYLIGIQPRELELDIKPAFSQSIRYCEAYINYYSKRIDIQIKNGEDKTIQL